MQEKLCVVQSQKIFRRHPHFWENQYDSMFTTILIREMLHTFKNDIGIICIFSIQGQVQVLTDRLKWEKIEMNDDDFPFWHSPHLSADCCNAPFLLLWYLTLSYFFFRNAKMYHWRLLMRPFISMICYISVGYFTLQHNLHTLDWHWFILQKRS